MNRTFWPFGVLLILPLAQSAEPGTDPVQLLLEEGWSDRITVSDGDSVNVTFDSSPFLINGVGCLFVREIAVFRKVESSLEYTDSFSVPFVSTLPSIPQMCPSISRDYAQLEVSVADFVLVRDIIEAFNTDGATGRQFRGDQPQASLRIVHIYYLGDSRVQTNPFVSATLIDTNGERYIIQLQRTCEETPCTATFIRGLRQGLSDR